jgi:RHS repeat-associated protein
MTQSYSYDSLHRLTSGSTGPAMTMSYDQFANITSLSTSGTMAYADTLAPYTLTSYVPGSPASARDSALDITYTVSGKPKTIVNSLYTATLSYGPGDDRDGMVVKTISGGNTVATRRYLGGCYEQETNSSGTVRRLWVGGDAYSAPVVLVSTNGGAWTAMAVGRDYLGSIIAVANASGTVVERNAWDPWGRALNPSNLTQYSAGSEPALALGRGFTGHEWLPWFSLWNANARIYDPLLGRFLSPDPYVQAPEFSQNFNRYAYCLNNPLKYTDEDGKVLYNSFL